MIIVNRHTPVATVRVWKEEILGLAPTHRVLKGWTAEWSNPRGIWKLRVFTSGDVQLVGPGGEWMLQDNDVETVQATITAMGALPS